MAYIYVPPLGVGGGVRQSELNEVRGFVETQQRAKKRRVGWTTTTQPSYKRETKREGDNQEKIKRLEYTP